MQADDVSVVESLERREVLSGAGVPFASIPAMVAAKGQPAHVVVDFDAGELASERLASYNKLQREAIAMQARTDQRLAQQFKRQHKAQTRASRARYQHGHKGR